MLGGIIKELVLCLPLTTAKQTTKPKRSVVVNFIFKLCFQSLPLYFTESSFFFDVQVKTVAEI
jgi:hypothetical protein